MAPPIVSRYAAYTGAWDEMLNDQLGDCVATTIGHSQFCWTANASAPVVLPDSAILVQYESPPPSGRDLSRNTGLAIRAADVLMSREWQR
jgi:hypothetical protein